MGLWNQGRIYTKDHCIGCNRCIRSCPVVGANVAVIENGKNRVFVNGDKCLHCGACLQSCKHEARAVRDDWSLFLSRLEQGEEMSIIVASSFWDLFGEDASRILEILKKKGVKTIYSLEQGEQIHAWASGRWMEMRPQPWISSVCPVTSLYIQREYPELLSHLLPVLTPLECAVVYYRNHHRDTAPMAYLGPCLATAQRVWPKGEAYSVYALTFEGMFEQFPDIVRDEVAHTGYAYHHSSCKQEGCSSTQVSGTQEMVAALRMYKDRLQQGYPLTDYLELFNCEGGCKGEGGSILPDFGGNRKEIYRDLCLEDYVRSDFAYEKPKDAIVWDNQEAIFRLLHKYDEESRHIDCHACGYDSCMTMNRAIACGYNHKENCIQYMRDENLRLLLTDTVTGIPNTNAFMKKIAEVIKEGTGKDYVAVFFNIRNFKLVNKKYGSKTGDKVLVEYSRKVASMALEGELVARWGGDNYVAAFRASRLQEAMKALDDVVILISRGEQLEECHLSIRAAVYYLTGRETIAGQVMGRITTTYATMNKQGRGHILVYSEELAKKMLHDNRIEEMLEPALLNKEFQVYYQPKVDLRRQSMSGAEALVRWKHNGKIILPMDFIPLCENNGFVQQIDYYVLDQVCRDLHDWIKQGYDVVKVSFNFSKQHFAEKGAAKKIFQIAQRWHIPRHLLEVEFTEMACMEDYEQLVETVEELETYGIAASIDDFGTGYSSLNLLQDIRFATLKLDRSFVKSQGSNQRNKTVVTHIVRMAKELDMSIVAEGVETQEELKFIEDMSCDIVQGYFFDKPLEKEEFEKRLCAKYYGHGKQERAVCQE